MVSKIVTALNTNPQGLLLEKVKQLQEIQYHILSCCKSP